MEEDGRHTRYFLEGMTVLDCTRLLPGAFASLYLADMGAEVIKVEQPGVGDYARVLGGEPGTEWADLGERTDCCLFPVLTMEEVWDHRQVKSRDITTEWGTEDVELTKGFRFPVKISGSPSGVKRGQDVEPAPGMGEHNLEVLGRVGLARDELMELAREGVV